MIFDDGYDKALWLMLHNDVKSRKIVIDFINNIPSCLFETIIDGLKRRYNDNKLGLFKEVNDGNYKYSFKVDFDTGEVFISRYLIINGNFEDVFILKILPVNLSSCGVKKDSLGSVIYMYRNHNNPYVWECDKVDYDIRKVVSKLIVSMNREYDTLVSTKYRIIDEGKIPMEVDISSFNSKEKNNKIIRKRNKKGNIFVDGGSL